MHHFVTRSKNLSLTFVVLASISVISVSGQRAEAGEWITGTVRPEGSPIYRAPDESSEHLGRYPGGMVLRIFSDIRNGFYAIYFKQPWKGTQYVWVPESSVDIQDRAPQASSGDSKEQSSQDGYKNSITLEGNGFLLGPSAVQTFLGDAPTTFFSIGFGAEYEHRFSSLFAASIRGGYYSFSNSVKSAGNAAIVYGASGYTLTLGLSFFLLNSKSFSLEIEVGGGGALSSAGNTSATAQVLTTQILSFPIVGSLAGSIKLAGHFYALTRLGYQIHSLGALPLLTLPSGTTGVNTNFVLNAPFASVGLSYQF